MNARSLGPSFAHVVVGTLASPVFWLGVLAFLATQAAFFVDLSSLPLSVRHVLAWLARQHIGVIGVAVSTLVCLRTLVCYSTSSYAIDDNSLIVVHGFFSPLSRGGWFKRDSNGVAFNLIVDVDPQESLVQLLSKSGTVKVTTLTGEVILLPFVNNPAWVRQELMAKAAIIKSRPFARIGVNGDAG